MCDKPSCPRLGKQDNYRRLRRLGGLATQSLITPTLYHRVSSTKEQVIPHDRAGDQRHDATTPRTSTASSRARAQGREREAPLWNTSCVGVGALLVPVVDRVVGCAIADTVSVCGGTDAVVLVETRATAVTLVVWPGNTSGGSANPRALHCATYSAPTQYATSGAEGHARSNEACAAAKVRFVAVHSAHA